MLVREPHATPDVPGVTVADGLIVRIGSGPRTAGFVRSMRVQPRDDFGQQAFVNDSSRKLFGVLGRLIVVVEAATEGDLVILVVAGPNRKAGMVAQSNHILFGLEFDALEDGLMGRVDAATEHEILPDEQSQFVTGLVENIVLVDAAAPNTNHGHVAGSSHLKAFAVTFRRDARQKIIVGNPVRSATKN